MKCSRDANRIDDAGRFHNITAFSQTLNKTSGAVQTSTTPLIDQETNRFVTTNQNFRYDKNGNLTTDGDNREVIFNGENKQYEVKNASGQTIGRYLYDGEGKRVKKITWNTQGVSETTIFVYSAGKLVAEYSDTQVPVPNKTTRYLTEDHLGTPRVITDSEGNVISRRDFLPFGEEITPDIGARSSVAAYQPTTDNVKQKFTGYQKDDETGLDFAEARMYENRHGRFTAVDPLLASGKSANPQTFNRFVYVGNNPLVRIDPNGKEWIIVYNRVKVKETVTSKSGKTKTVEKWIELREPYFVNPGELPDVPRISGVFQDTYGEEQGFVVLHPTTNQISGFYQSREEAESKYKQWLLESRVDLIDSGQGLPSELPENRERIRERLSFMLNSQQCAAAQTEAGIPTLAQVLQNRGLTIADPEVLRNPNSVSMIGNGFNENARQLGLRSIANGDSEAFSIVPQPYDTQPGRRVFSFFKPDSFGRTWFGLGQLRLDENEAYELAIHDSGVPGFERPRVPGFGMPQPVSHDLSAYPYYRRIISSCSPSQ